MTSLVLESGFHIRTGHPASPSVAVQPSGDFLVGWYDSFDATVWCQLYDIECSRLAPALALRPGLRSRIGQTRSVVALNDGSYAVCWQEERGGLQSIGVIWVQLVDRVGQPVGAPKAINGPLALSQAAQVIQLADGNLVVMWNNRDGPGSPGGVEARILDSGGAPLSAVLTLVATSFNDENFVALSGGGFLLTWTDYSRVTTDEEGMTTGMKIVVQKFDTQGAPISQIVDIAGVDPGGVGGSKAIELADHTLVVQWTEGPEGGDPMVYVVALNQDLTPANPPTQQGPELDPTTSGRLAALPGGGFMAVRMIESNQPVTGLDYEMKGLICGQVGAMAPFQVFATRERGQWDPNLSVGGQQVVVVWSDGRDITVRGQPFTVR